MTSAITALIGPDELGIDEMGAALEALSAAGARTAELGDFPLWAAIDVPTGATGGVDPDATAEVVREICRVVAECPRVGVALDLAPQGAEGWLDEVAADGATRFEDALRSGGMWVSPALVPLLRSMGLPPGPANERGLHPFPVAHRLLRRTVVVGGEQAPASPCRRLHTGPAGSWDALSLAVEAVRAVRTAGAGSIGEERPEARTAGAGSIGEERPGARTAGAGSIGEERPEAQSAGAGSIGEERPEARTAAVAAEGEVAPLVKGDHLRLRYLCPPASWLYVLRLRDGRLSLTFRSAVRRPGEPAAGELEIVLDDRPCLERLAVLATGVPVRDLPAFLARANAQAVVSEEERLHALAVDLLEHGQEALALLPGAAFAHAQEARDGLPPALLEARAAMGREKYPEAEAQYRRLLSAELPPSLRTAVRVELGECLRRQGSPEAGQVLEAAFDAADAACDGGSAANAARELGRLLTDQRRFDEAWRWLRRALEGHRALQDRVGEAFDLQHVAWACWRQGRMAEARATYGRILEPARQAGELKLLANALAGVGQACHELGFLELAWRHTRQALKLFKRLRSQHGLTITFGELGLIAQDLRRPDVARQQFERQLEASRKLANPLAASAARLNLGGSLLEMDRLEEAERLFEAELSVLPDDAVSFRLKAGIALVDVALKQGRLQAARARLERLAELPPPLPLEGVKFLALRRGRLRELEGDPDAGKAYIAGIEAVERARAALPPQDRGGYNELYAELFDRWIQLLVRRRATAEELLTVIELARARAFSDALRGTIARPPVRDRPGEGPEAPAAEGAVREALTALSSRLHDDVSIVVTYCLDDQLLLVRVTRSTLDWKAVEVSRSRLQALCGRVVARCGAMRESTGADVALEALAGVLRRPMEAWLEPIDPDRPLGIIPHGPLHGVPIHALPIARGEDGAWRPLCVARAVFYAPSLQTIVLGLERTDARQRGALLFADSRGDLPFARIEARRIAALLEDPSIRSGSEATAEALRRDSTKARFIHLAVHASRGSRFDPPSLHLAPDPGAAEDRPAPWEMQTLRSSVRRRRGEIDGAWVSRLELSAELVVLSGCESGAGRISQAGEGVDHLSWAFLAAGARSVISSGWKVHDQATCRFMCELYRHLVAGLPRAVALARVQRAFLEGRARIDPNDEPDGEAADLDLRRPCYWAAFSLMGDWR